MIHLIDIITLDPDDPLTQPVVAWGISFPTTNREETRIEYVRQHDVAPRELQRRRGRGRDAGRRWLRIPGETSLLPASRVRSTPAGSMRICLGTSSGPAGLTAAFSSL